MKHTLVLDIEVYKDYFLCMFKSMESGTVMFYEMYDGQPLNRAKVRLNLQSYRIVTFNGINYDMPMLSLALRTQLDTAALKAASDDIITNGLKSWQFEQKYGVVPVPNVDHIDLIEPVPGVKISLKLYGARLHSKRLQDLPIEHTASISPAQRPLLRSYCENDLNTTIDLWRTATDPSDNIIETREALTTEFGLDMRSKSDAQCAEAMIKSRVSALKGEPVYKQVVVPGTSYRYTAPAFVKFKHPSLVAMLADVLAADFVVQPAGNIKLPEQLARVIHLGASNYSMGIGGLHSQETRAAHIGTATTLIRDFDVVSYYPSLIIMCGLSPRNMGAHFQTVYRDFYTRRIAAKKAGNKSVAQTLKIVLNGTFGKLGSVYSAMYSPDLLIQVTVTGQLAMLMLIERMEAASIPVVSANTDGIVMACPVHLESQMHAIVKQWEVDTGLVTEETKYRAIFSRDVNAYLALKANGGYKSKGVVTPSGPNKNPDNDIVAVAVCNFLDMGIPITETILRCTDLRMFLRAKRVTGGGQWGKQYLGRVVRWYRAVGSTTDIRYVTNNRKVGGSDNAMPVMDLPDQFPANIDYDFYLTEASDLLRELGATK